MDSDAGPSGPSKKTEENLDNLQKMNPPAGYVYVIRDIEISGTYKIGSTGNPAARFAQFDADLPLGIAPVLIFRIDDDAELFERRLQSRYQRYNKYGEWYRLSERDIGQLREQTSKPLVFERRADFTQARAEQSPREVTYIPPHIYKEMPRIGSGYLYVIQDEEFTKLFRILWTNDPKRINWFDVRIPFFGKVVHIEPAESVKVDELNRRYAEHRRVGKWLDLNDEQLRQIRASAPQAKHTPPAPSHNRLTIDSRSSSSRRRWVRIAIFLFFVFCVGLAFIIGSASDIIPRLLSPQFHQTESPMAAPAATDDAVCDLSQYEYGQGGYILCSSVPNYLKPVRRGHCLYEYLDDRDRDGAVCE